MRALLDRKWEWFARTVYTRRFAQYNLMLGGAFCACVCDEHSVAFGLGTLVFCATWATSASALLRAAAEDSVVAFVRAKFTSEWGVRNLLNAGEGRTRAGCGSRFGT
eukprot:6188995-Pleurochrysis_carterae.AAC.2